MSPFLSYSGRGRSQRGRGRGRGRVRAGRGNSINRRANFNAHTWVRPPASIQTKDDAEDDGREGSTTSDITSATPSLTNTQAEPESNSLATSKYSHRIMKKTGQHKLVLTSKTTTQPVDSITESQSHSQKPASQGQTLKREGRNKLVSLAASNSTKPVVQKPRTSKNLHPRNRKSKSVLGRQKVQSPPKIKQPAAKRVKLQVQPPAPGNEDKEKPDSTDGPTEKLSDFAYKEVSRVRQRERISGRSLKWSKNDDETHSEKGSSQPSTNTRPTTRNMGLVRIQPNEKTTPICPKFLRGLHCQDPFCRKRHDIPKEYAMPVCSFFQKHGQCLRGDECQFRHVKLNASALVCPSFAILGFCEDKECQMQHVRGPKTTTAASKNEKSSSRFQRKPNNVYHRNKSGRGGRN